MTDGKQLVLVVGVGRSGTSAFTGILRELGYQVPLPEVPADETNPRGFGEPLWVVELHKRLLRSLRGTTFDSRTTLWPRAAELADDDEIVNEIRAWLEVQLVGADRIIIKDPRITWFLPLWNRCATDLGVQPSFVTMLRPPPEVLRSARQWYGTWQTDASRAAGWANVMLHTESQSRGSNRVFVRYDRLLADWVGQIARVGHWLQAPNLTSIDDAERERVDEFVDPELRRQTLGWEDLEVPTALRDLVDRTWHTLLEFAEGDDEDAGQAATLDDLRDEYGRLYAEAEAIAQSSVRAARRRKRAPTPSDEAAPPAVEPSPKAKPKFRKR